MFLPLILIRLYRVLSSVTMLRSVFQADYCRCSVCYFVACTLLLHLLCFVSRIEVSWPVDSTKLKAYKDSFEIRESVNAVTVICVL